MHTDGMQRSVIEEKLNSILRRRHRVLILLPPSEENLIHSIAQAVDACGCVPVIPEDDYRWKTLLRLAFVERTETVVGTTQLIMGLLKVAKATMTPLFVHDVLLCGAERPCIHDDLHRSLDCRIWNLPVLLAQNQSTHNYAQSIFVALQDKLLGCPGILDFSMNMTECGTSLEVVALDNHKITMLPSCAKLLVRKWNPETDVPFSAKKE